MTKRGFLIVAFAGFLAVLGTAEYYRREKVRNSTDYTDVLGYERMSWLGISVDYRKEPLVAWKIVSGPKQLELTGGGRVQTCMDEHLLLGDQFEAPIPANLGEALDHCKAASANK
jgi:hypothetical protein